MLSRRDQDRLFWIEFFDIYKQYPELWKIKSEAYKNRILKRRAYGYLLNKYREYEPPATESTLKKKINNIRACYRRELNKVIKSEKSGCNPEDVYKPTLWYFENLSFLKDQLDEAEGLESYETECETTYLDSSEAIYNFEDQDPVALVENKPSPPKMCYKRTFSTSNTHSKNTSKRLATEKALEDLKSICKALNQPSNEEDEFDCFGESIACQLKKLPDKMAQESMDYIQSYLVRQRIKSIGNLSSSEIKLNKRRRRSDDFDSYPQAESKNNLGADIDKRIKEKEIELMQALHNEKLEVLKMEMRNLENRFKYDAEEHTLKMHHLSTYGQQ